MATIVRKLELRLESDFPKNNYHVSTSFSHFQSKPVI